MTHFAQKQLTLINGKTICTKEKTIQISDYNQDN